MTSGNILIYYTTTLIEIRGFRATNNTMSHASKTKDLVNSATRFNRVCRSDTALRYNITI